MQSLQWKPEFSIGIDAIDRQHRAIFEHMLALENAMEKRDPWHILHYFIAELTNSLKFHLAIEDTLLEIVAYPGLESHRADHDQLTMAITELEVKIKHSADTRDLLEYFEKWFIRHVLQEDRQYAAFIKDGLSRFPPRHA